MRTQVVHRLLPWMLSRACRVQVPLACDLSRVVAQLAVRGQYSGTVELAVRKAQALDPEEAALQPGAEGDAARQVIRLC